MLNLSLGHKLVHIIKLYTKDQQYESWGVINKEVILPSLLLTKVVQYAPSKLGTKLAMKGMPLQSIKLGFLYIQKLATKVSKFSNTIFYSILC